ncbi:MAG: 30S ribosomal protein S20 [Candidatus Marinimicrobia bacterium]|jgi:small subunit ribosomal protein S20|nr:30S ribosomal protein S20 [Candidatus Neomarinimicrobiota bacterium]MDP6936161.1 30S ribosomal protein S20 [Candidatus Neomarinimicrobiota bacterium]
MGATGSELKRVRQSRRDNLRNRHYKSMMKTSIKKVLDADKGEAASLLSQAVSTIDRVCGKGIIHKNRAAQHKSKLTKYINSL